MSLISLFHFQIQEPTSRSTAMRAFVFLAKFAEIFVITKYLTQEVNDNLNVCMDERSSCDQKVMTLLPSMKKCPMQFYQGFVHFRQVTIILLSLG